VVDVHARWPVRLHPRLDLGSCISASVHKRPPCAWQSLKAVENVVRPTQVGPGRKKRLVGAAVVTDAVGTKDVEGATGPAAGANVGPELGQHKMP